MTQRQNCPLCMPQRGTEKQVGREVREAATGIQGKRPQRRTGKGGAFDKQLGIPVGRRVGQKGFCSKGAEKRLGCPSKIFGLDPVGPTLVSVTAD